MVRIALLGLLEAMAGGLFLQRTYLLYRLVRLGRPERRLEDLPKRVELEATVVLGQRKLLQRLGPGLMHAFIFWGFIILLTTIVEALGEIVFGARFAIPFIGRAGWLGLAQDLFAEGATAKAENYQSWNITKKGLMFTFDPYQVGPYAAGSHTVIVPYAQLKEIAKADAALMRMMK